MPPSWYKIHWQGLSVYRNGEMLSGRDKEEALLLWRKAEDPKVYVFPSYRQHEVDFDGIAPNIKPVLSGPSDSWQRKPK